MAAEKKITSRIQQKHDVAANWAKATNFIPKKGEIIIYDAEYSASGEETQAVRFKIGDGSKTVNNLPFAAIDYKSIKSINTNNTAAQAVNTSEAIAGSGTINLHKVAKTGSYNDLLHKPTIPAVNNGALTLTVNGTAHTFTANQSGDTSVTINDTGVTSVSLSGDGNAVTNASIDGRALTLTKGTTFLTSHQSIKSINTNNTTAQEPKTDESIAGSGTINLHKIAKTGNYNDLLHKPTLGTAAEKNIGTSSGNVPILDSNGKLADSVIPAVAITDTYVIDTEEEMLALSAQKGDIAIRSDLNKSYVLQTTPASTLANWKELLTPTDTVLSVNGQTGTVELTASDVKALPSSTKYAASSEVGGAATSANKVNSNLIVKLNSGATEGTNLFTFNGSAAKTINITPSAIGAAASSHGTHVTADTVKAALGTGSGTSKYLREDGTWQTPSDTHYTNYLQIKGNNTEAVKFTQNADKTLNFKPGTNVSISAASGEITISSTDTNTATAADNILDGSNSGTEITYKPYTSQQSKLSFDTSTTNPTRTDRLNLNGHLHATKLYSGGKEVLTSHQDISGKANLSGGNTFSGNQVITGALYPEQNAGATFGNETHRWNNAYIQNSIHLYTGSSGTPNIDVTHTGLTDGTNPTSNIYSGLNFEEKDGKNLSEFRNQVTSAGRVSTDLWTRSFGTDYGNYVGLFAAPNAGASNSTDVWHFSPNLDAIIDLGQSNLRWRNVRAVTTYSNVYGSDLCSTNSLRLKDPNITRGTNQAASGGKQNYYRAININDKNNHKGVGVEWGYLCEKNSNGNTTKHVSELNLLVYPPNTTDNANFVKVALGKRSDGTTYFTYAGDQVITTKNFSLSGTTLTITM